MHDFAISRYTGAATESTKLALALPMKRHALRVRATGFLEYSYF